ncbi:hypothetical protein BC938DRAFT_478369, partial [Jimgerdemannia flammicorona]
MAPPTHSRVLPPRASKPPSPLPAPPPTFVVTAPCHRAVAQGIPPLVKPTRHAVRISVPPRLAAPRPAPTLPTETTAPTPEMTTADTPITEKTVATIVVGTGTSPRVPRTGMTGGAATTAAARMTVEADTAAIGIVEAMIAHLIASTRPGRPTHQAALPGATAAAPAAAPLCPQAPPAVGGDPVFRKFAPQSRRLCKLTRNTSFCQSARPSNKISGSDTERRESTTIYVGNLPYSFRERDVADLFERYGRLRKVTVLMDNFTSRNKGFAFVEFEDRRDAEDAFDMYNSYSVEGRRLKLD